MQPDTVHEVQTIMCDAQSAEVLTPYFSEFSFCLPGGLADAHSLRRFVIQCLSTTTPPARWEVAKHLPSPARYGGFFGGPLTLEFTAWAMTPSQSQAIDPQQVLLLEASYSVLAASIVSSMKCYARGALRNSNTGVYIAMLGYSNTGPSIPWWNDTFKG